MECLLNLLTKIKKVICWICYFLICFQSFFLHKMCHLFSSFYISWCRSRKTSCIKYTFGFKGIRLFTKLLNGFWGNFCWLIKTNFWLNIWNRQKSYLTVFWIWIEINISISILESLIKPEGALLCMYITARQMLAVIYIRS